MLPLCSLGWPGTQRYPPVSAGTRGTAATPCLALKFQLESTGLEEKREPGIVPHILMRQEDGRFQARCKGPEGRAECRVRRLKRRQVWLSQGRDSKTGALDSTEWSRVPQFPWVSRRAVSLLHLLLGALESFAAGPVGAWESSWCVLCRALVPTP